jgi:hypothetical protein
MKKCLLIEIDSKHRDCVGLRSSRFYNRRTKGRILLEILISYILTIKCLKKVEMRYVKV